MGIVRHIEDEPHNSTQPAAGWRPDPQRPDWNRWWDGVEWADFWRAATSVIADTSATESDEFEPSAVADIHDIHDNHGSLALQDQRFPRRGRLVSLITVGALAVAVIALVGAFVLHGRGQQADRPSARDQLDVGQDVTHISGPDVLGPELSGSNEPQQSRAKSEFFADCESVGTLSVPGTDVSVEPVSVEQEREIGAALHEETLKTYVVSDDVAANESVQTVIDKMVPTWSEIDFDATVVVSDEVNAWITPGGYIYFTTVIVDLMTDDELAFIAGHELSHEFCGHLRAQIQREALTIASAEAINRELGLEIEEATLLSAAQAVFAVGNLSFSREDEGEADLGALELLASSGVPLNAGPSALSVLLSLEGDQPQSRWIELMSTHPLTQSRIDALNDEIG